MDSKTQNVLTEFGGEVGKHMGRLYTLSIIQTSALLDLATAMKNEKNLSPETREAADKALKTVDRLIGTLDEAMGEIDKNAFDVESYVGAMDE